MQWSIFAFLFNVALVAILALLIRNRLGQSRMASGNVQLGPLDPQRIPESFKHKLKGERVQFWEKLRGWDLQHKPLHINQRGLINRAIVTNLRVLYVHDNGRSLRMEFDFALAGVDRLNLNAVDEDQEKDGIVFIEVFAGEVRHYLLARKEFAHQLAEAATVAKHEQMQMEPEPAG